MTDDELCAALEAERFSGRFTLGGASASSDGKFKSWGGERIMELVNPDGPAAAARIRELNETIREQAMRHLAPEGQWIDKTGALEARLAAAEKMAEALRPFAEQLKGNYSKQPDTMPINAGFGESDLRFEFRLGDFRRARRALAAWEAAVDNRPQAHDQ